MGELRHQLFRLSANEDAQLLLTLVVCLNDLQASRHPSLGPVLGVSAWDLADYIADRQGPGAIHPSADAALIESENLRSRLSRLKRLGYVRNGSAAIGEPSVWRPSAAGYQFLAARVLFKPEPGERRRPAA
jgi:hypothetical protein